MRTKASVQAYAGLLCACIIMILPLTVLVSEHVFQGLPGEMSGQNGGCCLMDIQWNTSAQGLRPYLLHATQILSKRQHLNVFINFSIIPTMVRLTTLKELRKYLYHSDNYSHFKENQYKNTSGKNFYKLLIFTLRDVEVISPHCALPVLHSPFT